MLIDGLNLNEGSVISNLTVASGSAFPSNPAAGELFFRTDLNALHVYNNSTWVKTVDTTAGIAWSAITSKPTTLSGYGITDAASIGGSSTQTFGASTLTVTGSLLPTVTSTQDIGSASMRWRAIYVDDLHLSTNTLYLGDTPVMGTNANTIEIKADPDQSMLIKTQGTGTTQIQSASNVHIYTSSAAADVLIQTSGTGAMTRFQSAAEVRATAPVIGLVGDTTVTGAFTVTSGLTVNGALESINSTNLVIKDNVVVLNSGESGNGVTNQYSGLQFDRGGLADWQLVFDESDDKIKAGAIGSLVALATATDIAAYAPLAGASFSGNIVVQTGSHITLTDAPVNGTDAVNKNYVDANMAGLTWKNSVKAATTANITLSGTQTVDGVALVAGDRVLVKDQTTATQNGIYVVAAGAWSRATDMDQTTPLNELNSAAVFVEQGTSQADTGWTQVNNVSTLGTDAVAFTQFNGAAGITAGTGLVKTGNTLDINLGAGIAQLPSDEVGIDVYTGGGLMLTVDGTASSTSNASQLSLTKTGVTAGAYSGSVTVDAYGRVTAAAALTASDVTTALGATAVTNATNAANVGLADTGNAGTFYVTLSGAATGNNALKTDTSITYNAATNVLSTTASSAQYADLAENYVADAAIEAGTVVDFGGEFEVTVSAVDGSRKVAGVVSTAPAYLMNDKCEGTHVVPVAFQGRVPCKVVGKVAKGDMLVSAGNGAARAEADPKIGSVIGKALQNFDGEAGVIEVVVGRD